MKLSYMIVILVVFAWPLYYLYQNQLGAISFLLLAIFFFVMTLKEMKKLKEPKGTDSEQSRQEKFERNNK